MHHFTIVHEVMQDARWNASIVQIWIAPFPNIFTHEELVDLSVNESKLSKKWNTSHHVQGTSGKTWCQVCNKKPPSSFNSVLQDLCVVQSLISMKTKILPEWIHENIDAFPKNNLHIAMDNKNEMNVVEHQEDQINDKVEKSAIGQRKKGKETKTCWKNTC